MRLTAPRYYDFGQPLPLGLDTVARWDHLRTQTTGAFRMATSRAELQEMLAARPEVARTAAAISAIAGGSLASYGVGGGLLEIGLKVPELQLTDAAPVTVARLAALFPEARVMLHDLRSDGPLDADLHLFHRIDTEMSNRQWRRVFEAFSHERIVFVAGGINPVREIATHLFDHLYVALHGRRDPRMGLMRTRAAVEALWKRTHRAEAVRLGDAEGWLLSPH